LCVWDSCSVQDFGILYSFEMGEKSTTNKILTFKFIRMKLSSSYRISFRPAGTFCFIHVLVAFWSLFPLLIAATDSQFRQTPAKWEQTLLLPSGPSLTLGLEREVYEPLDGAGRFVIAVQRGTTDGIEKCEALWTVRREGKDVAAGRGALSEGMLVVDFPLQGLEMGRYDVEVEIVDPLVPLPSQKRSFEIRPDSVPPVAREGRIPLIFPDGLSSTPGGHPMTFGVPMPKGALADLTQLRVVDSEGNTVPAQFIVRSRWGYPADAGVRWLGVDIQSAGGPAWWPDRKETPYFLEFGGGVKNPPPKQVVEAVRTEGGFQVNTGPLQFLVKGAGYNLIDNVSLNGRRVLDQSGKGGGYLVDHQGSIYRTANDTTATATIEEQGPLRVVIRVEGWYIRDGSAGEETNFVLPTDRLCKFISRIEAYAGLPWVRVLHTWINTSDSFNVSFRDIGFSLVGTGNVQAVFGVEGKKPIQTPVGKGVYLLQHLPDQFVVCREDGAEIEAGSRSNGSVSIVRTEGELLTVANREMWERFPKELEVFPGELRLHVWPVHGREHPDIKPYSKERYHQLWFAHQGKLLDLRFPWKTLFGVLRNENNPEAAGGHPGATARGGVHSSAMGIGITNDFMIRFGESKKIAEAEADAAAFEANPMAGAHPDWIGTSNVMGLVHPYDPERFPVHEKAAKDAMFGLWDLQDKTGEYGMFLYRGWHHSAYLGNGYWNPYRLYSAGHHYEAYIPWLYFARSGDPRHGKMAAATMRTLTDLGTIHYDDPRYEHREFASPQGRLIGSTRHTNGFVFWGGDHSILAHLTGYGAILLAHYLTGDLRFHEVAVDEWQSTLLEDRANPQWGFASRMNWGENPPSNNRDNNNAVGEMLDLYQQTYDPRILALLQPAIGSMETAMTPWAREMKSVLAFRRNPKLKSQLLDAAAAHQADPTTNDHQAIVGPASQTAPRLALAAWAEPGRNFERAGWFALNAAAQANFGQSFTRYDRASSTAAEVPDRFLEMPMVLSMAAGFLGEEGGLAPFRPQVLPMPSPASASNLAGVVVREDADGDFVIRLRGRIRSATAWLKVLNGDGKTVHDAAIPIGNDHRVTIPKDGFTGEYVLLLNVQNGEDFVQLPVTSLGKEVYPVQWMVQTPRQWYHLFLGAPNAPDGTVQVADSESGVVLESLDRKSIVAERSIAEAVNPLVAPFPEEGVWFRTGEAVNYIAPMGQPWLFSLSPASFFKPSAEALGLIPGMPVKVHQELPMPSPASDSKLARVVVREDVDDVFTIRLRGKVQSSAAWLKVLNGIGKVVHDEAIPVGENHEVTIPKDGFVGDYVLLLTLKNGEDFLQLPITTLEKEIYPTRWMVQSPRQRYEFFLGAANAPDGTVRVIDSESAVILESLDRKSIVAERSTAEAGSPLIAPFPEKGVWFRTGAESTNFIAPEGQPWLFSLSPEAFFKPSEEVLQLR